MPVLTEVVLFFGACPYRSCYRSYQLAIANRQLFIVDWGNEGVLILPILCYYFLVDKKFVSHVEKLFQPSAFFFG
ncbi:MAG: hypothetical protein ACI8VC_002196 [Candidatus Endobugula sp.]